jgi:hypothetical protein
MDRLEQEYPRVSKFMMGKSSMLCGNVSED